MIVSISVRVPPHRIGISTWSWYAFDVWMASGRLPEAARNEGRVTLSWYKPGNPGGL